MSGCSWMNSLGRSNSLTRSFGVIERVAFRKSGLGASMIRFSSTPITRESSTFNTQRGGTYRTDGLEVRRGGPAFQANQKGEDLFPCRWADGDGCMGNPVSFDGFVGADRVSDSEARSPLGANRSGKQSRRVTWSLIFFLRKRDNIVCGEKNGSKVVRLRR